MNESNSIRAARLIVPFPAKAYDVTAAKASVARTAEARPPHPQATEAGHPANPVAELTAPVSPARIAAAATEAPATIDEATFSAAALSLAERATATESRAVTEERFEKIARIRAAIADGTYDDASKIDAILDRVLNDVLEA